MEARRQLAPHPAKSFTSLVANARGRRFSRVTDFAIVNSAWRRYADVIMHLNWNEIRVRAARFAQEWKDAEYEKGETQSFYNEFFESFGVRRRRVASYEEPVKLLGERRGFIDLFWKGVLLVEQKSAGRDLVRAKQQALEYFPGLKEYELPRYILVSDFQHFELYDLDEDTQPIKFRLRDLGKHIEAFTFILGVEKRAFRDQDPVNINDIPASEMMFSPFCGYCQHNVRQNARRIVCRVGKRRMPLHDRARGSNVTKV